MALTSGRTKVWRDLPPNWFYAGGNMLFLRSVPILIVMLTTTGAGNLSHAGGCDSPKHHCCHKHACPPPPPRGPVVGSLAIAMQPIAGRTEREALEEELRELKADRERLVAGERERLQSNRLENQTTAERLQSNPADPKPASPSSLAIREDCCEKVDRLERSLGSLHTMITEISKRVELLEKRPR